MSRRRTRRELLLAVPVAFVAACSAKVRQARKAAPTTTSAPVTSTTTPPTIAQLVRKGPNTQPVLALTFHGAGDPVLLDQLLAVVAQHDAKITVFAVGKWLDANPDVGHRILAGGHELANHTYTHPSLGTLAAPAVLNEITGCRDALTRHVGAPGKWFRASGIEIPGDVILRAAATAGYPTVIGYDVDPLDYQDPGAHLVRTRTVAAAHPGAIVSMHTGHPGTVEALPYILTDLAAKGLRPVTVSRLLAQ